MGVVIEMILRARHECLCNRFDSTYSTNLTGYNEFTILPGPITHSSPTATHCTMIHAKEIHQNIIFQLNQTPLQTRNHFGVSNQRSLDSINSSKFFKIGFSKMSFITNALKRFNEFNHHHWALDTDTGTPLVAAADRLSNETKLS